MIKRIFITGIQAFVPIAVTFALVVWIFTTIEKFMGEFLKYFIKPEYYFNGLGILVGIAIIFLIGILVNAWVIKKIYALADSLVKRIPLIKTVYNAMKDLMAFFDKGKRGEKEQRAVIIETAVGRMVGFVTRENLEGLPDDLGGPNEVLVYIPFSYQIGGFMVSVSKDQLTSLDIPVNQAMSMVVTAGMTGGNK